MLWILETVYVNVNQSTSGLPILLITTQSLLMFTPFITNLMYGYPKKMLTVNGGEFENKKELNPNQ